MCKENSIKIAVTPMPPIFGNVAPLTIKQINGIKTRIAEGAKNN